MAARLSRDRRGGVRVTSFFREGILRSRPRCPCATIFRGRRQSIHAEHSVEAISPRQSVDPVLLLHAAWALGRPADPMRFTCRLHGFFRLACPSSGRSTSVPSPCRCRELLWPACRAPSTVPAWLSPRRHLEPDPRMQSPQAPVACFEWLAWLIARTLELTAKSLDP